MKRILVIDDEELLTKTFARLLETHGYEVLVASNSEDAMAMAQEEAFDFILSDVRMPGLNGVETVKKIYEHRKKKGEDGIPVIFITGYADPAIEKEARSLNPIAYIFKPFNVNELLNLIKKGLGDAADT